jgi:RimJ/RimL family protein N-acetyltransferase
MKIPVFTTERLILREVLLSDAPAYAKHFIDYEVISQLAAQVPWPYPEGGIEEHIRERVIPKQGIDKWVWGISLRENPEELIGVVDLWREGRPEHRGFWLGRAFWGKGYLTEAVRPVMDFAFDQLGFEKLVFSNALGNTRSRRIKEKTGARLVGTKPTKFVSPEYTESEVWELTKEEWVKFRAAKA